MRKLITIVIIILITVLFNILLFLQPKTKGDIEVVTMENTLSKSKTLETTAMAAAVSKSPYEKTESGLFEDKDINDTAITVPVVSEPSEESNDIEEESSLSDKKIYKHYDKYIWVGDSRTEGLANSISIEYLAAGGKGLSWCKENMPEIYNYKNYNVMINFGINDIGNVNSYIDYYNNLPEDFVRNNQIFIISVNPVNETIAENVGYTIKNNMIKLFNEEIQKNLQNKIYFIDTYTYLQNEGFDTNDGVHYSNATYVKLYNYIRNQIERND